MKKKSLSKKQAGGTTSSTTAKKTYTPMSPKAKTDYENKMAAKESKRTGKPANITTVGGKVERRQFKKGGSKK